VNNDKKTLDVVDWQQMLPLIVPRAGSPSRYFSPASIGVLGTLLIHALILPSAYFASYGTKVHLPEIQAPGAFATTESNSEESLVLISLPTKANSGEDSAQSIDASLDLRKSLANSLIHLDPPATPNLEMLSLGEEPSSQVAAETGDGAEQARLYGIYTGQIQARVNRIWRRSRTPVNETKNKGATSADESFQCDAQVVQDAEGNVQEILLPRCNGSFAWQHSLVLAIQQASPLPAPPSPSVFSPSITLHFTGLPYFEGAPADEYELEPRSVARAN
jgi:TonB C terminal